MIAGFFSSTVPPSRCVWMIGFGDPNDIEQEVWMSIGYFNLMDVPFAMFKNDCLTGKLGDILNDSVLLYSIIYIYIHYTR